MPPFIPHKRRISASPPPHQSTPKSSKKQKPSLFEIADRPGASASLQDNKAFLDQLNGTDSESALSDMSSDEFEDVLQSPKSKKRKLIHAEDDDDNEIDWEDAIHPENTTSAKGAPEPSGDLELTLDNGGQAEFSNSLGKKKGPSKIERQIRIATHCMHVQFLLFHNLVRNGWACDKEVQNILVGQLPANVMKEVEKWTVASGLSAENVSVAKPQHQKRKGKKVAQNARSQRDWGKPAERQENGAPNMSRGDPLIRLLKILAAYWKKRWTIISPSLRKQGYKSLKTLEEEITSFKKDEYHAEVHGERIRDLQELRAMARKCEGSRDVGAQLFTALIRGLGVEARLIASLQPVGFGWSKGEEASAVKRKVSNKPDVANGETSSSEEGSDPEHKSVEGKVSESSKKSRVRNRLSKGAKSTPINLADASSDEADGSVEDDDEDSVVDVTPVTPRKRPNMNYDRDMVFPTYWTEAVSPITNEIYPVDPFILNPAVATNQEHLSSFESRGTKADKAKQVFAYVIGYSQDGTAKDVTTRYLKRHMWPGRTKGVRMPVEKVPVYNHRGKIKRYEDYDWFKTVMSGYGRSGQMRTAVDDLEEAKDLKAIKPEKKEPKAGEDTLQGYKTSAEFVLERHLRREEAIKPGSEPVKTFTIGKGDKAKEEPVWLRKDVEVCRTGESWHKEGRIIKAGETPMKMVPIRAVTLTRKREVEEAERDSGEKLKQGLYSWDQTEWIIPPPIENGVIPKNAYGNMDCFVPTMVPKGAVHIPLRSTKRICTRLGIDYAEAVTGFEFGNKRAVPVITGVIVADENENAVIDEWEKDEEERRIREEGKREKAALSTWRKWLMGLRIIERVREEYGGDADAHVKEGINPFTNQSKAKKVSKPIAESGSVQDGNPTDAHSNEDIGGGFFAEDEVNGGGFFPEGHEEEEIPHSKSELLIEHEEPVNAVPEAATPMETSERDENSDCPSTSGSDEPSTTKHRKPKSLVNRTAPNNAKAKKTTKTETKPTPREPLANGSKRKASASPPGTDTEPVPVSSSKQKTKPPPKRRGRPRKAEVKSRYFEQDSDDDEIADEGSKVADSEEELAEKPFAMGATKSEVSNRRRSARVKKNT